MDKVKNWQIGNDYCSENEHAEVVPANGTGYEIRLDELWFFPSEYVSTENLNFFRTYAEPKNERPPCRPVLHRRCNRRVNFSPAVLATSHRPTLQITLSFGAMIRSIVRYAARSGPPGRCGSTCAIRFHSATRAIYSLTTRCSTSDIRISLKWYDDSGAATPTQ